MAGLLERRGEESRRRGVEKKVRRQVVVILNEVKDLVLPDWQRRDASTSSA
jgi:hypothetical protein